MRAAAVVSITLATASCSWLQNIDTDPTADWSADKLYSEARSALDESDWTRAKEYYTKLEARYPFGQYAQQGQIELIYAYWKDGDAAQAVQECDRFLQAYPNHPNSDYVMYLKGLATLNQTDSWFSWLTGEDIAERDANAAQEAFDIFKELVLRYPDSRYAPDSRRRMHQLVNSQARHEYGIAKYYYDRHAYVAAIDRAQTVVREFQNTSVRDDALELIAKCYDNLEMPDLANDTRRVIELNKGKVLNKNIR
jgi:outer membrane protein assembly factor BamD